ncbi:hypothetical protein BAY59_10675 [Prauserella coralliicola]|nr:hypothetical protein BAY59_10675 [Prauserella coralliicola]
MPERLSGESWAKAFSSFRVSAFRWEAQGVYREPHEQEPLRQFLAGEAVDTSFVKDWLAEVRRNTDAGRRYSRVRVLTDPLTDYLRFELAMTPYNIDAGEDVRVLSKERQRELSLPSQDFWLFDDEWAAVMRFGDQGLIDAEVVSDPAALDLFREIRDLAWKEAVPFRDYMAT